MKANCPDFIAAGRTRLNGSPGPQIAGGRSAIVRKPRLLAVRTSGSARALLARWAEKWFGNVGALSSALWIGVPGASVHDDSAALMWTKVCAPAARPPAAVQRYHQHWCGRKVGEVLKNGTSAAACTTASIAGKARGALLSRSASTGIASTAFSLAWEDAERVRPNILRPSSTSFGIRRPPSAGASR